jgi:hypothetical protein
MTDVEKDEASSRRVRNPHVCKCGYRAESVTLSVGLDYTPFLLLSYSFNGNTS